MLNEAVEHLNIRDDGVYVDATIGGGGHSYEIASKIPHGRLIGIDTDQSAIDKSMQYLSPFLQRVTLIKGNFRHVKSILQKLEISSVDGILMDLGISSHQIDTPERGFSYQHDAFLDMRMDPSSNLNAYEIINKYPKEEIADILFKYGEEKFGRRIAGLIEEKRRVKPIETTFELVDIIKQSIPAAARREGGHPAKRTFQAIRIAVNDELNALESALSDSVDLLNERGRLVVITFQSLEDRIVKNFFNSKVNTCTCPADFPVCICGNKPQIKIITKKALTASGEEIVKNPRSKKRQAEGGAKDIK